MKLSFLLKKDNIAVNIKGGARTKKDLVSGLLDILYSTTDLKKETLSKAELLDEIMKREAELATAVGKGFFFPHSRVKGLKGTYQMLAVSSEGLSFETPDNEPVKYIILSLVPYENPSMILKTRAAAIRFLKKDEMMKKVLSMQDSGELWDAMEHSDVRLNEDILARDIMSPQFGSVSPDMSLRDAAAAMHKYHTDSLPLIGDDGKFISDITCYDLFSYGLPGFFSSLKTISFVKHMDPFEKYFQVDRTVRVDEIKIDRDCPAIPPDYTLMEIIFEMTAKNRNHLYVVENGFLLGTIERYAIVDKILLRS